MNSSIGQRKNGFTLIEMLIVIGVLGLLLGLLSPAIIKNIKMAQKNSRRNEIAVLEAAIMEFWHDQGRWPIKAGDRPNSGNNYTLTYWDDNHEVFNQLLNADFGGRTGIKDYIDVHRHAVADTQRPTWPASEGLSLKELLGDNKSGAFDRPLVFRTDFIQCPYCNTFYDLTATECTRDYPKGNPTLREDLSDSCSYYRSHFNKVESAAGVVTREARYQFGRAERNNPKAGLRPYTVQIDMLNNTVTIRE